MELKSTLSLLKGQVFLLDTNQTHLENKQVRGEMPCFKHLELLWIFQRKITEDWL